MKASAFSPRTGFIVTKKEVSRNTTATGLEVEENSDDFLVYAEVVVSGSSAYVPGDTVVYHVLDSQSFRDGADTYNVVQEGDVLGTYDPRKE
jgi:co-chaperonin GroES (HSP10)